MQRVVVFGRGGAGKSTLGRRLTEITRIPVIELDKLYWDESARILSSDEWSKRQSEVIEAKSWILDGDLGPYDERQVRLSQADTVIILDTPLYVCLLRALRRGRQRLDFWIWVCSWGRKYKPQIVTDIHLFAPNAIVITLTSSRQVQDWLMKVKSSQ